MSGGFRRPEVVVWLGETREVYGLSGVVLIRSEGAWRCFSRWEEIESVTQVS